MPVLATLTDRALLLPGNVMAAEPDVRSADKTRG